MKATMTQNYIDQAIDFMGFHDYYPRTNYIQEVYPSETLGGRIWMEDERRQRKQKILDERNKSLPRRLVDAAPRFLEAFNQRLFSSLFLTILFITAFSPVLCALAAFGGVGFVVTVALVSIQTISVVIPLMPLIFFALLTFFGIFTVTMVVMVFIKCINVTIQWIIQATLRVQTAFGEFIHQMQVWYLTACRLCFNIYLDILRVIFFPFILAQNTRRLVQNAVCTVIVKPISCLIDTYVAIIKWFLSLPFNMINGVVDVIMIILGVQRNKPQKPLRRGSNRDICQPSIHAIPNQHYQPMNAPQILTTALDLIMPCENRPDNDEDIPDLPPYYCTWDDRYYELVIQDDSYAS